MFMGRFFMFMRRFFHLKAEIPFPSNGDNFMPAEMKESPF